MPSFSMTSKDRLNTCHHVLRTLFFEVIKYFDCTILYGYREPAEQLALFKRGRKLENGVWVIENKLEVVTYCDGYEKLSNHNARPSDAVDVAPYPIDWQDTKRLYYFAGFVKGMAEHMGLKIIWGGDWQDDKNMNNQSFFDLPHFERVKE